ncbi:MAG: methyltransferase, partial [Chloroflexota bacterium]|nr:methyltransferase [Chloroflexota bacterium]
MKSRERVWKALNHQEPDRVPLDSGSTTNTSIHAVAYNRLKRRLGIAGGQTLVYDLIQGLAAPEQWFLDRFQVDVVNIAHAFCDDPNEWVDWKLTDGSRARIPAWIPIRKEGEAWVYRD